MAFRALALVLLGAVLFTACDSGRDYPSNKGDDEYDLAAMALTEGDMAKDFAKQDIDEPAFTNEQWAEVFDTDDLEGKLRQLEAQGRLTNHVTAFTPPGLGKVLAVTAVSTLYTDDKAAEEATNRFACGLPIKDSEPLDPFVVPRLADQATGFFVHQENSGGISFVDTTVCFRTGRIVHALQQTSLPGIEDIALAVRTAQKWLRHVDDAFDGVTPTKTPEGG